MTVLDAVQHCCPELELQLIEHQAGAWRVRTLPIRSRPRFAGTGQSFLKAGADAPETLLGYADFDGTVAGKPNKVPLKTWAPHIGDRRLRRHITPPPGRLLIWPRLLSSRAG